MKHLDEATIQSFLDGELPDALSARVTQHIALCARCANALVDAEAESAEINFAFSAEISQPVPTQRIWARIENEIDTLAWQPQPVRVEAKTFWQRCGEFFTVGQIAFAGGLAAIVMVSLFGLSVAEKQFEPNQNDLATATVPETKIVNPVSIPNDQPTRISEIEFIEPEAKTQDTPRFVKASYDAPRVMPQKIQKTKIENQTFVELPLAEEKDYLNTIAQLSRAVETSGGNAMRPSHRVEYERNLATVNGAIKEMQRQARANPRDENARKILLASYQNKIDLLSTVTEKTQLIASLR